MDLSSRKDGSQGGVRGFPVGQGAGGDSDIIIGVAILKGNSFASGWPRAVGGLRFIPVGVLLGMDGAEGQITDTAVGFLGDPADTTPLITRGIVCHGGRGFFSILFPGEGAEMLGDGRVPCLFDDGFLFPMGGGDHPGFLRGVLGVLVQEAVPVVDSVVDHLAFPLGPEERESDNP
jgi:hypothetical protein